MADFQFQELQLGQQYMSELVVYKLDDIKYCQDIDSVFDLSFEELTSKKIALRADDDKVYISKDCDSGEINEFIHNVNFKADIYIIDNADFSEMIDYFNGNFDELY